jgi:hypothetical protein
MRDTTDREAEEGFLSKIGKCRAPHSRNSVAGKPLQSADGDIVSYVSFRDAVEAVKMAQPWEDPANPETDFLRELRLAIADKLGIGDDESALGRLRIFTAIGSSLDVLHRVDGFVEYEKEPGNLPLRAYFDLTQDSKNPKKNAVRERGILVIDTNAIGEPEHDEARYLEAITDIAERIAAVLRDDMKKAA